MGQTSFWLERTPLGLDWIHAKKNPGTSHFLPKKLQKTKRKLKKPKTNLPFPDRQNNNHPLFFPNFDDFNNKSKLYLPTRMILKNYYLNLIWHNSFSKNQIKRRFHHFLWFLMKQRFSLKKHAKDSSLFNCYGTKRFFKRIIGRITSFKALVL